MTKQTKKNTVKKNKKINKNVKKINNKTMIIIGTIIFVLLLLLILFILISDNKKIKCTRFDNLNGITEENILVVNLKSKDIKNITLDKTLKIEEKNGIDYSSIVEASLKDAYKNMDVDTNITKKDNKLFINLNYNKNKEYILDNVFVTFEEDNLNVNVISDDINNEYLKFDLSKKYSKENIISLLKKHNYICK